MFVVMIFKFSDYDSKVESVNIMVRLIIVVFRMNNDDGLVGNYDV